MGKLMRLTVLVMALGLVAAACSSDDEATSLLDTVIERDRIICGVNETLPGFGIVDDAGAFSGFDIDYCRVVAAGVLGDANKVDYVPLTAEARFTALQRESGYYPGLRLSSGLGALSELAGVLLSLEDQLGRYQIHNLTLKLPEGGKDGKGRTLTLDVAFRSDEKSDFRTKSNEFVEALRAAAKGRDSAFRAVPSDKTREKFPFTTSEGQEGFVVTVVIELKPESQYPVFPKTP